MARRPQPRLAGFRVQLPCLLAAVAWLAACDDGPTATPAGPRPSSGELRDRGGAPVQASDATFAASSLTLPFNGSVNSAFTAFRVAQTGTGPAGAFEISNTSNAYHALLGQTNGSGPAVRGITYGPGRAGYFQILRPGSFSAALEAHTNGDGTAVQGIATGTGRAGVFRINNAHNFDIALLAQTLGTGTAMVAVTTGSGRAGFFQIHNTGNASPALGAQTNGTGPVLQVNHIGSAGPLAVFQTGGVNKARISRNGKGFFNGGTQTGGADVAEAFEVEGDVRAYGPGDVLVISDRYPRRAERSVEPYSARVIGVYATRPGLLLTERDIDDELDDMVPVGVLGVIPTRVSAENGAIELGDLLVSSATPGHAMRASPERLGFGMLLGKALEPFAGPGTGVIEVMVNVR